MRGYEKDKTRRVIRFLLFFFVVIALKVWHLTFIQREERLSAAMKPKRKTIVESAHRGEIFDRFGAPLALNRIRYDAAIYYNQILQVPSRKWIRNETGKRVRTYPRREYIKELSELLANELQKDPERIEDLIHSRAALFPHVPFILQENISEEQYFRLRMLERNWLALHAQCSSERYYPKGKSASNILGYLGAMNSKEYWSIARELSLMQKQMEQGEEFTLEREARYKELKERAYTIHDFLGKTGIEARYEKELRGFYGKKTYEVDIKGNCLRAIGVEKEPTPGKSLTLSLSSELQEFSEGLLAHDETLRDGRSLGYNPMLKKRDKLKQPWIKGGAVVAMDPRSGEIVACATYPRFDPNHFIPSSDPQLKKKKIQNVLQWLESPFYVAQIWNGKIPLKRERFSPTQNKFWEETLELRFETFLDWILPKESQIKTKLEELSVKEAIELQENVEALCYYTKQKDPKLIFDLLFPAPEHTPYSKGSTNSIDIHSEEVQDLLKKVAPFLSSFPSNGDKLFYIDLVRLFVHSPAFSDELIEKMGHLSLPSYHTLTRAALKIESVLKEKTKLLFHEIDFKSWRLDNFKDYLAEMRASEKERKTYARPYLDYLNRKERQMFNLFYNKSKASLFLSLLGETEFDCEENEEYLKALRISGDPSKWKESFDLLKTAVHVLKPSFFADFLRTVRSFEELDRPLYTRKRLHSNTLEKHLAASFYPQYGFSFSRSYAFQQACTLGSIFKLVTAYEALKQSYLEAKQEGQTFDSGLFRMIDKKGYDKKFGGLIVGYTPEQKPYPRFYKGGRLPKSASSHIGEIDLQGAIEHSSNPYFSLLTSEIIESSDDLEETAEMFGFGKRTGFEVPGEFAGSLPKDLKQNRTGLYSFAIGQHSLVTTPLQTAVFLSALANEGKVFKPKIVHSVEGTIRNASSHFLLDAERYPLEKELSYLGVHFPLFTEPLYQNFNTLIRSPDQVLRSVFLPERIRDPLIEGMHKVITGSRGSARASVIKNFLVNPSLLQDYLKLRHSLTGKTSTAEIMHQPNQNPSSQAMMYKDIWFAGISFEEDGPPWNDPDLVVVVYLRYGDGGKEAVPIASQVIKKWKEIQEKHKID